MPTTIRLTLTDQLEKVLSFLEEEHQPLSRAEIIKLALAQLYRQTKLSQGEKVNAKELNAFQHIEEDAFYLGTVLEKSNEVQPE